MDKPEEEDMSAVIIQKMSEARWVCSSLDSHQ
jgi:hypothetical protein